MDRYLHKLIDIYIKNYVRNNPGQLKRLDELISIPNRFLVISSTALGDTILSTPAIKSLRQSFPEAEISMLIHKNIAPLFKAYPYVDNIILYHGGYKKFFLTLRTIRKTRPEAVLIFHGNGPQDIAFSVLSGANIILKPPTKSSHKKYLSAEQAQKKQHTIEDRLEIVRMMGGKVIDTNMEIPAIADALKARKIENFIGPDSELIGFQLGAANVYKMWPVENYIKLARRILETNQTVKIVITGVSRERRLGEQIVEACGSGRILNSCGMFAIDELPYLIKRLRLLITVDTGTLHLAIALCTPTLSLFSATDPFITGPYQDPHLHDVIRKDGLFIATLPKKQRDDSAMRLISVGEVYLRYEDIVHNRPV
ncbi:MAG: glycosyltransferase family 9 protein [Dissulfurispiraceae bacterium]|jgi:ADP-heptose:LPS heptosyltransferase